MKKAIVTGANGFIGRFMVRELVKQNVEVIAVVRENSQIAESIKALPVRFVACELAHIANLPDLIPNHDIDAIFHMAWQGVSNEDAKSAKIQLDNVRATLELVDAAHTMSVPAFVGAGSIHEAEALEELKAGKSILNPGYMYKSAKLAAHMMGKARAGGYGIRFFWPLINTYGEEETSSRLINTVIRNIYQGKSPALSSGEQIYDFVHVSDVAHAMYLIAEAGADGANYVIGSGEARPLKDYLSVVGEIANELCGGPNIPLGLGERKANVVNLPKEVFDISRLTADTGFKPQVAFREGIERTARWILEEDFAQAGENHGYFVLKQ